MIIDILIMKKKIVKEPNSIIGVFLQHIMFVLY